MSPSVLRRLLLLVSIGTSASCEAPVSATEKRAPGPVEVGVVTLAARPVTLTRELPGRVASRREAQVRARVDGIVEAHLFTEGSDVKEGQDLYRIEAAPYKAALASAKANLARAQATFAQAKQISDRNASLIEHEAVSEEELENSMASLQAAQAEVAARRAAVKAARIDLGYTTVQAPISGRIGRSEVTEGAYVQRATATLMATIRQLDPVYVDITQSSAELLRLRREVEAQRLHHGDAAAEVTILLEDGHTYAETGTLQFADARVDESTGSVTLRALVPNPDGVLLPGMFVRARLEQGTDPDAILVPQRAVTRNPQGQAVALVVDDDNAVRQRQLVTDRVVGHSWLVSEGLSAGDRVIVEGLQKVRPGDEVVAKAVTESAEG